MIRRILSLAFCLLLAACAASPSPAPTQTPPTDIPVLAVTPTPIPAPTITPTPFPSPTAPPTAAEAAASTPTPTPTPEMAVPGLGEDLQAQLDERFGEVEPVIGEDGTVFWQAPGGHKVGVCIAGASECVLLPEDSFPEDGLLESGETRRVPPGAEIIIDDKGQAVVFGAGTRLYRWSESKAEWMLDMSEVDIRQFSEWAYQLAEEKFGPASETRLPIDQPYWRNENGGIKLKDNLLDPDLPRISVVHDLSWLEGLVIIAHSGDPRQELALVSLVRRTADGGIARALGLGFLRIKGRRIQVKVTINDDSLDPTKARWVKTGDRDGWFGLLAEMEGRNVGVITDYELGTDSYCDPDNYLDKVQLCGLKEWIRMMNDQGYDLAEIIRTIGRGEALDPPVVLPLWLVAAWSGEVK